MSHSAINDHLSGQQIAQNGARFQPSSWLDRSWYGNAARNDIVGANVWTSFQEMHINCFFDAEFEIGHLFECFVRLFRIMYFLNAGRSGITIRFSASNHARVEWNS